MSGNLTLGRVNGQIIMSGGGGTPYDGLSGEVPPERCIFFRLQVYKMVGILLVEVHKRGREICHLGL